MIVLRQSAVILGLQWLLAPLQLLTAAVVARSVGPEGKGVLFLLGGVTAVVTTLASIGMSSGAFVVYKQGRRSAGEVLGTTIVVSTFSFALIVLLYALVADGFVRVFLGAAETSGVEQIWIVLALACVLPTVLVNVGDVLLIADDAMDLYALRSAGTSLLGLLSTWILTVGISLGVTGVLLSQSLACLFGAVIVLVWLRRKAGLGGMRVSIAAARDVLSVGVQQYGVSFVALVAKRFDVFFIAAFLSVREAGYYAIARMLHDAFVSVPRATMWPLASSLCAADLSERSNFARVLRVQLLSMIVVTAAFVPLAPVVVPLVFGLAFIPAVGPVQWAMLGVIAAPIVISTNAAFTADGRPSQSLGPAIVATIVQIALNFALVPSWGVSGSAIALSANHFVLGGIQLAMVRSGHRVTTSAMLIPSREDLHDLKVGFVALTSRIVRMTR